MPNHWTSVSIGVASLDDAARLWVDHFGFERTAHRIGPDPALAELWSIAADSIAEQWLLESPGQDAGRLHLVRFAAPASAVRDGAQSFDLCPKNLDVYVDDIAMRVAELKQAGMVFRNETHSDVVAPDGTHFREIHLPAHDHLNVVLLEVVGQSLPFSPRGFLGVGPLVTTVADANAEQSFYREIGFSPLAHNVLDGPEIERMIGLPAGASLDIRMLGAPGNPLGEMEIIQYGGTAGVDLYPRTRPPARGIIELHLSGDADHAFEATHTVGATLIGTGSVVRRTTPAGFRVNIWH